MSLLSVCDPHMHSVASTVMDEFFSYLAQVIIGTSRCVTCNDFFSNLAYIFKVIWPWFCQKKTSKISHIFSCMFPVSTVLDGLFSYLAQMISCMKKCVLCNDLFFFSRIWRLWKQVSLYICNQIVHHIQIKQCWLSLLGPNSIWRLCLTSIGIPIIKMGQTWDHLDGLMQERRNSIAKTLELRLSCPNPSILCLWWELLYW